MRDPENPQLFTKYRVTLKAIPHILELSLIHIFVEKVEEVWTDMENTGDKRIHLWSNGSYQAYYIDDKVSTLVGKDPKKSWRQGIAYALG